MCVRINCYLLSCCMSLIILAGEQLLALCGAGGFLGYNTVVPIVIVRIYRDFRICAFNSCLMTAVTFVICAVSRLSTGCSLRIMVSCTMCAVVGRIKRKCCIAALNNRFTIVTYCVSAVSCFGTGACSSFNVSCINVVIGIYRNFRICAFNSCLMTAVTFVICAVSRLDTGCSLRIMVSCTMCAVVGRIKRKCCIAALYNRFTIVTYCVSAVSCFGTGACSSFNVSCINVVIGIYRNFRICAFNSCLMTAVTFVICAVSRLGTGCSLRIMVSCTMCAVVVRIKRKCCIAALYNLLQSSHTV